MQQSGQGRKITVLSQLHGHPAFPIVGFRRPGGHASGENILLDILRKTDINSVRAVLISYISDVVQICCLDIMLRVPGDYCSLDLLLPELPKELFPGLVEYEAAADLDILVSSQLHFLEQTEG